MRISYIIFLVSFAFFLPAEKANADLKGDLKNFWERSGGGINHSRPMTYDGQRAGFVTLGSVQVRTRNRNSNLANIQLPSVRAGCGGIDLFGGAFSFISKEELIALMEAIMQNASGFAFELALESMSPAVQETVSKLRDLVNQVNAMNINSCEAGQVLTASLWPKMEGASQHICQTIGSYQGIFADRVSSRHGCTTGGDHRDTMDQAAGALDEQVPYDVNYAWEASKKNAFLSTDKRLAEFFMTLTGTIVTLAPADDDTGPIHRPIAPRAASEDMLRVLVEGGTVKALTCGDDDDKCLDPTYEDLTLPANLGLYQMTADTIRSIRDAIIDGEAEITDEAVALLGMTSVPVLDMLVTGMSYQHVFVDSEINSMAEVVAVDLAMVYIDQSLQEMRSSAGRIATSGSFTFEYQDSIRETQNNFGLLRQIAQERYSLAMRSLERLAIARKELAAYSSTRFAAMLGSSQ